MRNRPLHQALQAFVEEAADQLGQDAAGGEVPFEVTESPGDRSPLYCYRPLTRQFIDERFGALERLETYPPAVRALDALEGLDDYLNALGEQKIPEAARERSDAALRALLDAVFGDASEFELSWERFGIAYRELETHVYVGRALTTVVAPLLGLEIESDEIALGDGLSLMHGEALEGAPAEAIWSAGGGRPSLLAVLTIETAGDEGARAPASPVATARKRFRRLLTALRLFGDGSFALGPAAWTRADAGVWRLAALGGAGRTRGAACPVTSAQEDELRGFVNLIAKRVASVARGEIGWALARFEMGCERIVPFEALTDHLLALRALLEPEGPASGRLAQRLAAICATPYDRPELAERMAHAISLERAVIAGIAPAEPGVDALVVELEGHLRALLRDVLCGHLDSDLCGVADSVLEEAAEVSANR